MNRGVFTDLRGTTERPGRSRIGPRLDHEDHRVLGPASARSSNQRRSRWIRAKKVEKSWKSWHRFHFRVHGVARRRVDRPGEETHPTEKRASVISSCMISVQKVFSRHPSKTIPKSRRDFRGPCQEAFSGTPWGVRRVTAARLSNRGGAMGRGKIALRACPGRQSTGFSAIGSCPLDREGVAEPTNLVSQERWGVPAPV